MSADELGPAVPLFVNFEHALLKNSILTESILLLAKSHPRLIPLLPLWTLHGRSSLAHRVSEHVRIDWSRVPMREEVLARIRAARDTNRDVVIVTTMPKVWADDLAAQFPLTTAVFASGEAPLPSAHTVDPPAGIPYETSTFDYIGDGRRDATICSAARRVTLVSSNPSEAQEARSPWSVDEVIPAPRASPFSILKLMRVHQWLKNALLWVPLLAAHKLTVMHDLTVASIGFLAFCFCASSVYILNDLFDLDSDRQHVRKRYRPLACGAVSANLALVTFALLLTIALLLAFEVSTPFVATLGLYFFMTLAYSLRLKRQVIVDVMLLAALYTIRVIAGAVATSIAPSFWLLALSMFMFLSLAIVKRYSEMLVTLAQDKQYAAGRGYSVQDMPVLLSLGVSTGIAAIVVLALYINDPVTARMYPSTMWLWPIPPLMLYWISRVWMKAHRGEMHDDPVVFATRDWQSLTTLILGAFCFYLAIVG